MDRGDTLRTDAMSTGADRGYCWYCGRVALKIGADRTRCSTCALQAVDRPSQVARPSRAVFRSLRELGIEVSSPVVVELRSVQAIQRHLPTLPDGTHGVTRTQKRGDHRVGPVYVTIRAGLPLAEFEACFAHELVHVALGENGLTELPDVVEEGVAQYVAWMHLKGGRPDLSVKASIERIELRRNDVYGDGFQLLKGAAERRGFVSTWAAILERRFVLRSDLQKLSRHA